MNQFSNDGTPVQLEIISGDLLFIDPLYFQDIINHKDDVEHQWKEDNLLFVKNLEEKIFPYGGGMLLGYKRVKPENSTYVFNLQKMQQFDHENSQLKALSFGKQITAFATDSGTLLILDMANFGKLLDYITYDDLIDAALKSKSESYFQQINAFIGNRGWSFVETPGINSGFVFEGVVHLF